MKALLCALTLALVPVVGNAADMHGFDYTGTGNPVPLAAPAETRGLQAPAAAAVTPSPMFLTRESDFSKFLKADVPLTAHRQALRLLWATHPEFGRPSAADTLAVAYPTETIQAASLDGRKLAALGE